MYVSTLKNDARLQLKSYIVLRLVTLCTCDLLLGS